MRFISTRGHSNPVSFTDVVIQGLAPDGGLYMPETFPRLDFKRMIGWSYQKVAVEVISHFATDIPRSDIVRLVHDAYETGFGSPLVAPLLKLNDRFYIIDLTDTPTLSFKDYALRLLGRFVEYILERSDDTIIFLGATSGDTGTAAIDAMLGLKRVGVVMLSPHGRMSDFQRKQMYTIDNPRIRNLSVRGTFDACQASVKAINRDAEFKSRYRIGAVNSINLARLIFQSIYYVFAYVQLLQSAGEREFEVCVPTGNLGNGVSCEFARQMGVPIKTIILATNENRMLVDLFETGVYRRWSEEEVRVTTSPSMDIADASNAERFFFEWSGRDSMFIRACYEQYAATGQFSVVRLLPTMMKGYRCGFARQDQAGSVIQGGFPLYHYVFDPHTAVGVDVGLRLRTPEVPLVVVATVHPAKFAGTIDPLLGTRPRPPGNRYHDLFRKREYYTLIEPDPEAVKRVVAAFAKEIGFAPS
jgi:threonine synthase